ncbi:MAG: PilT/PilU family type 4a pilus ATPase [Actinobacteria bacterium]|nr:PilT/PilU family type 4a pilus ATPase [Actinomycetota bacterium]
MVDVDAALKHMVESGGSDLHIKVPAPPTHRLNGVLEPIPGTDRVMPEDAMGVLEYISRDHPEKFNEFKSVGEVDFAYALPGVARFRVNAFRQRGSVSIVMRAIGFDIKTTDELLLPPSIKNLAEEERGVILVTGTTGSGKSTTLAAMIRHINDTMPKHIITLEDPIEFLHKDSSSIIQQREVGEDTESFTRALRRILRQDPDVILIGEMRDEETVSTALSSAETGHLVFSTLHTLNATETINRIIDFFPLHQNKQVRAMLAGTLKGIVSQRLVRTVDGKGRVPICEVMIATNRIKDMIVDPEQTSKIEEAISEGQYYGMQTFDQALLTHLKAGNITMEEAMKAATSPNDFKLSVAAGGDDNLSKVMETAKADHVAAQEAAAAAEEAERQAAQQGAQHGAQQATQPGAQPPDPFGPPPDQPPSLPQTDPADLAARIAAQQAAAQPGPPPPPGAPGAAPPPPQHAVQRA